MTKKKNPKWNNNTFKISAYSDEEDGDNKEKKIVQKGGQSSVLRKTLQQIIRQASNLKQHNWITS